MKEIDFNYKKIDSLLESRIRLSIIAYLSGCDESDFTSIRDAIGATDGNLTTHFRKLEDAKYVIMRKDFIGRKPITYYKLSKKGLNAFLEYIERLKKIVE